MSKSTSKKPTTDYPKKMPRDYSVYKAIRKERDYKSNTGRRDKNSRAFIEKNYDTSTPSSILPGQLVMFNYFSPKTKDELEYYDAKPCTIFFGSLKTEHGTRVIGFNIHYYPPRIRFRVMQRIFEIFKPIYAESWSSPLKKEIGSITYSLLIEQLEKEKLDFGVRMYIPSLIGNITPIPTQAWPKAILTEGLFKKTTRTAIMNYWKRWKT